MAMTMNERLDHARAALSAYFEAKDEKAPEKDTDLTNTDVSDLIADLLHLQTRIGLRSAPATLKTALMHFNGERKDYATELRKLRIYDNGGETFDRYTAVFMSRQYALHNPRLREALGFSSAPFAPQGFGQHTSALPGRHLGKRIALEDLNADCQQFIKQNL